MDLEAVGIPGARTEAADRAHRKGHVLLMREEAKAHLAEDLLGTLLLLSKADRRPRVEDRLRATRMLRAT